MKKIHWSPVLLLFAIFLSAGALKAQQVVSAAGTHAASGTAQLSWTIGEPVSGTLAGGGHILTQGIHQGLLLVDAVEGNLEPGYSVSVYPNPATECLVLEFLHLQQQKLVGPGKGFYLRLYDVNGKLLLEEPVEHRVTLIPMDGYASSSVYFLQIIRLNRNIQHMKNGSEGPMTSPLVKTFKIIKQ